MTRAGHLPESPRRAFACMAISALFFSTMGVFLKKWGGGIPEFELVFFRSFINLFGVAALMRWNGEVFFQGEYRLLTFRGLAGFVGISCLFYSITHLPLSIAMMLSWSSPIFVILFSSLFFRERLGASRLLLVFGAFIGLLLLLNPRFSSVPIKGMAVGIGLLGAAASGTAYITVRAATARIGVNAIIFYFMLVSSTLSAPFAALNWVAPQGMQWVGMIGIGFCATVAQIAMTQGYRSANAGIVSTMNLLNVGFASIFGILFFQEHLSLVQWGGMALLAGSIALLAMQKVQTLKKTKVIN